MALRLLNKKYFLNRAVNVRYLHFSSVLLKLRQFILSDIGEGIKEVTVREWFVKVGDKVSQFDNLCLVESDKASVNITSRYDGIIKSLYYVEGDTALVGKPLVDIDTLDEGTISEQEEFTLAQDGTGSDSEHGRFKNNVRSKKLSTPAVRRIASEHNVSLSQVSGTGKAGRVMKEDILKYIENSRNSNLRSENEDVVVPISGIKKIMVKTMTQSSKIPTFHYYDEVNVSQLIQCRNEIKNVTLNKDLSFTYMPFFIKALSKCISVNAIVNSVVDEYCENYTIKQSHNIGVAVDSSNGLIVPNIKNVQNLTLSQINNELNKLIEKGRNNNILPVDMTNGTISISNIGSIGGTYAAPLINPPEVCILAIGKFVTKPLINADGEIIKGQICSLSWGADHRIIDGATVARFSNLFKEFLENPYVLLYE